MNGRMAKQCRRAATTFHTLRIRATEQDLKRGWRSHGNAPNVSIVAARARNIYQRVKFLVKRAPAQKRGGLIAGIIAEANQRPSASSAVPV